MNYLLDHPALLFVLTFIVLWLAAIAGVLFSRRRRLEGDAREDFTVVQAGTLTLLGLIIGFTFSMAISRYDQRKNYEEEEANAIGTEYLRAGLLPDADAARLRSLLVDYTKARVQYYNARNTVSLDEIDAETERLQDALWNAVREPAVRTQTPVVALAVGGMNDVINSQGYSLAAWRNRIPPSAWILMTAMGLCASAMIGFGVRSARFFSALSPMLPFVLALAFGMIADIDSPRGGLIHVYPVNLLSTLASMTPH